ncbi:glucokinase [Pseudomonas sp. MAP12]|uniref:Glucokinase n=1 Tax=Geopseudomonas aromaticivorans TaxID=2849492 RepID=A0ABS6N1W8_9GAMM|nr:glucokinase [Pseudomonas aromaticivorans]MBV2135053.1 glucokinase [Pseudomonas aromaticivorans]
MIILAADIGGTQARLLLGECEGDGWRELRRQTLSSRDYPDFDTLLQTFLQPGERPLAACIALAGPIENQRVRMTNLPWQLDAAELAGRFGLRQVRLLNDFSAQAHGLALLRREDLCTLQAGEPQADGVRALLGAGTGLGMALLAGSPKRPLVLSSEGGHADFAPQDEQQLALWQQLRAEHGRVSLELLLSGHGLERLYRFIADQGAGEASPLDARGISRMAAAGAAPACAALDLFARLYASAAGNLALTGLARGGVYLCGGIAPKILPFLQQPHVCEAFCSKPPMHELLQRIPLHVVLDEYLGLRGAAQVAARLASPAE